MIKSIAFIILLLTCLVVTNNLTSNAYADGISTGQQYEKSVRGMLNPPPLAFPPINNCEFECAMAWNRCFFAREIKVCQAIDEALGICNHAINVEELWYGACAIEEAQCLKNC